MTAINQKEYLKKYLGIGKAPGQKKKKKFKSASQSKIKIIDDDDVDLVYTIPDEDPFTANEDAPQIVAIIDERPPSLRVDEKTKNPLWQPIGSAGNVIPKEEKLLTVPFKINKVETSKGDSSPPRRSKRPSSNSPPRKTSQRDDRSPPRRRQADDNVSPKKDNGVSPQSRRGDDNSPPRKRKAADDNSPPRKRQHDDRSPPRRNRSDNSPARSKVGDYSPPRRGKATGDVSPPRKRRQKSNSPRRGKTAHDRSPARREDRASPRRYKSNDNSPSRKSGKNKKSRWEKDDVPRSVKLEKTLDGKSAGLQNAQELADETRKFRQREDELFKSLPEQVSGANAQTVRRERKTGLVRNLQEEEERQRKRRQEEEKKKEKYDRWGKGLAQVESREQKIQDELHEMSKPLARYADDEDLERFLKEKEREGDPMLAYIRSKKRKGAAQAGHVEKPQFEGQFAPNRFGIRPGHRWDGVDRSNGYEKKWFEVQNEKRAQQEDTYKWSTEDM